MLDHLLIRKKEIGKLKVALKNTLALTCEKITQNPRSFNTIQIKNAIDNLSIIDVEEKILPGLLTEAVSFALKDFFLYMHQTGLYNRQFKLWNTLASISTVLVFKLQKGFFKKKDLYAYIVDFYIEQKYPCISTIVK